MHGSTELAEAANHREWGRGKLTNTLILSWTTNSIGFSLQTTTNLSLPGSWVPLAGNVVIGRQNVVLNAISGGSAFYRLELEP